MEKGIIFVCNSINNKNIRQGELEILRKHEDKLYFEFGSNELNIKKRFYKDIETLNQDFEKIQKIKEDNEFSEGLSKIKEVSKDMEEIITSIDDISNRINETEKQNKEIEIPKQENNKYLKKRRKRI